MAIYVCMRRTNGGNVKRSYLCRVEQPVHYLDIDATMAFVQVTLLYSLDDRSDSGIGGASVSTPVACLRPIAPEEMAVLLTAL